MTQGEPLFPTIFNVVVEVVVRHWEYWVAERAGEGSIDDNDDAAQPAGNMIWARDDGQRQAEEGHAWLKVNVAFF